MNPKKEELSNWDIAEIVYTLRLLVDRLERRECSDSDKEIIYMAYRAMRNIPDNVESIVKELETEYNDDE
jgi:uncharacterized protein (DUF1015 family)